MVRALARVNLAAIERNCALLKRLLSSDAGLGVVVKADAYGHGAVPAAGAAIAGGASWLCVATAEEAAELRAGGIDARLLIMGALTEDELPVALHADADIVVWREGFAAQVERFVGERDGGAGARVHVKYDSGMGRLGTRDAAELRAVANAVHAAPGLELSGLMTHFATSDDREDDGFFRSQLESFTPLAAELKSAHPSLVVHAANSGATLRAAASHFDFVRCGIAAYGMDPANSDPHEHGLDPALALHSYVADVKVCAPGQSAGYGRRFVAEEPTHVATLPIGYADGVRRGLTNNADVLVRGRRRPLVGTVSMDNVTLDVGADTDVEPWDPAVLIGTDGNERLLAEELAQRLDTINYEITCGISRRVPREYHRDGAAA